MPVKVDPITGQTSTAENAIPYVTFYNRQKVDPFTGQPSNAQNAISRNTFYSNRKVDPTTGLPSDMENAITYRAFYKNKKVDPNTGRLSCADDAISYKIFHQRKYRRKHANDAVGQNASFNQLSSTGQQTSQTFTFFCITPSDFVDPPHVEENAKKKMRISYLLN